jgi:hypothetical protein
MIDRYRRLLKYDDPRARGEVWRLSMEEENISSGGGKSDLEGGCAAPGSCVDPVPEDCKLPY